LPNNRWTGVAELRFFGGLSLEETGEVLGLARNDDARLAGGAGVAVQATDAPAGSAQRRFLATRRSGQVRIPLC
jgi:hypothetical protein